MKWWQKYLGMVIGIGISLAIAGEMGAVIYLLFVIAMNQDTMMERDRK